MPTKCKERESILASGLVDVPALPLGAVRGVLCFRCFEPASNILKCGGCKRAGYCSKACQKLDWTALHKKQCKILQQINTVELEDYRDTRTWEDFRLAQLRYVRLVQSLTPIKDTIFIIQAQPYCNACYRSSNQLASQKIGLKACERCRLLHHCGKCSDSHSTTVCATYEEQNRIEQFRVGLFEDTGKASVMACTAEPRSTFRSLETCSTWYDYFINISDKPFIKGRVRPDFGGLTNAATRVSVEEREFEESRRMFLLLATDNLTMPLTILSALEDLKLLATPSLHIHILGATGREFLAMASFEEILHLNPALKTLIMTAIGPSSMLMDGGTNGQSAKQDMPCCQGCQIRGRRRFLSSYKGLYHDYTKSPVFEKPDLIVAFNSGFVDGDDAESDWDQTIRMIVDSGTATLFTAYNPREARNEQAKMKRLGARFVTEPEENKWRSLVPMPELLDVEYEIWYQNYYRYVIKGRTH
ncbi:hypothetical protein FB567DRAFT_1145 [Paraphoma chrysanthemicola]|uniref:MYND-type domain-containing protein n=1 Tax=Paraphoma chrysanthemicola TaxID=798071 RepID=A0A8K0RGY4_9PLEO|nr:hypothetical protein FB567DRAFT_1145 [Paraphoma chrysanthemicola]